MNIDVKNYEYWLKVSSRGDTFLRHQWDSSRHPILASPGTLFQCWRKYHFTQHIQCLKSQNARW